MTAATAMAGTASAGDLIITFTSAAPPAAVPFGPVTTVLLGLVLAMAAVVVMRKRGAGNGMALGLAALIGVSVVGIGSYARAAGPFTLTGPSPQTFTLTSGGMTTINNGLGVELTIDNITVTGPQFYLPGGSCAVGTPLPAGGACTILIGEPI